MCVCVCHLYMSSDPVPAAALQTGRGSESPPELPHSRTDSEPQSRSWNLHVGIQKAHVF